MNPNKQRVEEYLDALSGKPKPSDVVDRYVSDRDMELKGHIQIFEAGIPCYELAREDIVAEGNKVLVRFRLTGKHTGELFGCPPTGNSVDVSGLILYELEDGLIVNHWMEADSVGLMQQISTPVLVS